MTIETIVERQLEAYNSRDIETFMQVWADDAKYYEHPHVLLANGAEEIRERHLERFKDTALFGELKSRIVVGDHVIDHETVTRTFPDGVGTLDVVAIYQIGDMKISNAWFIFGKAQIA